MMNPTLDARLNAVLNFVRADVHADIGSDHAHLPIHLIRTGRVKTCVVVELNAGPLGKARQNVALAGLPQHIQVRQGDGFAPIEPGEVNSASLTGMGTSTMLGILERAGDKLPPELVLQPNDSALPLRKWALAHGYHLSAEALAPGFWAYTVLKLEKRAGDDPAYADLPLEPAMRYGPLLLRQSGTLIRRVIWNDIVRLTPLAAPGRPAAQELTDAQAALGVVIPLAVKSSRFNPNGVSGKKYVLREME